MGYISDQLIQINAVAGRIALLDRVAHVLDDIVGAVSVCRHVDQDFAQGRGIFPTSSINRMPALALLMMAESG